MFYATVRKISERIRMHTRLIFLAGFAMFSMFFGSGNLVFPLTIGMDTSDHYLSGLGGLFITGIIVPFLGLLAMILFQGNRVEAFNQIGKIPAFFLMALMLSLLGPFAVTARCIIVAFGGIQLLWPDLPFYIFSLVFSVIAGAAVWKKDKWMYFMGRYLTPILLLSMALIIVAGLYFPPAFSQTPHTSYSAFMYGVGTGYQTMDLLAAFFFAVTTVSFLRKNLPSQNTETLFKVSIWSSIVGGILLAIIYSGFVALGAYYADSLHAVLPEQRLVVIAGKTLGKFAMPIVATAIWLSCFTTFIALTVLFADFLRKDVMRDKLSFPLSLMITLVISFVLSLLGFEALAGWLAWILSYIYPALIALSVSLILQKIFNVNINKLAFWGVLFLVILFRI